MVLTWVHQRLNTSCSWSGILSIDNPTVKVCRPGVGSNISVSSLAVNSTHRASGLDTQTSSGIASTAPFVGP